MCMRWLQTRINETQTHEIKTCTDRDLGNRLRLPLKRKPKPTRLRSLFSLIWVPNKKQEHVRTGKARVHWQNMCALATSAIATMRARLGLQNLTATCMCMHWMRTLINETQTREIETCKERDGYRSMKKDDRDISFLSLQHSL